MATSGIAAFVALMERGVDYDRKKGVTCPACGARKVKTYRTMPWDGEARVRYHSCRSCGQKFKSTEQA